MNFLDYSYDVQMDYAGTFAASCVEFETEKYLELKPHEALAGRFRLTQRRLEELAAAGKPAPEPLQSRDLARHAIADVIAETVVQRMKPWVYDCICKYWPKTGAYELKLTVEGTEHDLLLDLEGDWVSQVDALLYKVLLVPMPVKAIPVQLQDPDYLDTMFADEADVMPSPHGEATARRTQRGLAAVQLGNTLHEVMAAHFVAVDFETLEMKTLAQIISRETPPAWEPPAWKPPAWTLRPKISQLALEAVQGNLFDASRQLENLVRPYSEGDQIELMRYYAQEIHRYKGGHEIIREDNSSTSNIESVERRPKTSLELGQAVHHVLEHVVREGKSVEEAFDELPQEVREFDYHDVELKTLAQALLPHLTKSDRFVLSSGGQIDLQQVFYHMGTPIRGLTQRPAWELRPNISTFAFDVVQGRRQEAVALLAVKSAIETYPLADQVALMDFFDQELARFREARNILRQALHEEGVGR